ncbi:putative EF-hand calcium-binding domain protein [Aspergillus tanneri]|uniref:Serine hydrolase domain-containing protein n=1 Tax=Aspergillus tanneri TaxID=1220188 RepID=A0A5M9MT52_9EURO|nr:uncharacterized protein ATNIH1004_006470 [Aspergillus tanneri]KAA8647769.1 hypothetical protein ATNIH1004_006470 [Aspergillus tanneri]
MLLPPQVSFDDATILTAGHLDIHPSRHQLLSRQDERHTKWLPRASVDHLRNQCLNDISAYKTSNWKEELFLRDSDLILALWARSACKVLGVRPERKVAANNVANIRTTLSTRSRIRAMPYSWLPISSVQVLEESLGSMILHICISVLEHRSVDFSASNWGKAGLFDVDNHYGHREPIDAAIRNRLHDLPIEYDFLDGPYPATAAAGIDLFYPPPYYSYLESNTPVGIRNSVSWLKEYIAQHGPYDAVMMFSQGCTIGASLLLLHQLETPDRPAPFKAAIFICGGPPLKLLEEVGYRISERVWERDATSRAELAAAAHSESILAKGSGRWNADAMKGETEEGIRGEISGGVKIGIPTVHVYGEKDPRYVAGIQLSETFSSNILPEKHRILKPDSMRTMNFDPQR